VLAVQAAEQGAQVSPAQQARQSKRMYSSFCLFSFLNQKMLLSSHIN